MIRPWRPSSASVGRYRVRAVGLEPSYPADGNFHEFEQRSEVGRGVAAFEAGKAALREWQMQSGAGVRVDPVPIRVGETPVLWTRTLGAWLLFACRISRVVDEPDRFGFTYLTLPGHPEQGEESFVLEIADEVVWLTISARSRPATLASRAAGPIGRALQRRFTQRYFDAMEAAIAASLSGGLRADGGT